MIFWSMLNISKPFPSIWISKQVFGMICDKFRICLRFRDLFSIRFASENHKLNKFMDLNWIHQHIHGERKQTHVYKHFRNKSDKRCGLASPCAYIIWSAPPVQAGKQIFFRSPKISSFFVAFVIFFLKRFEEKKFSTACLKKMALTYNPFIIKTLLKLSETLNILRMHQHPNKTNNFDLWLCVHQIFVFPRSSARECYLLNVTSLIASFFWYDKEIMMTDTNDGHKWMSISFPTYFLPKYNFLRTQ